MKGEIAVASMVLISLTNFVVVPLDGFAPVTAFILFAPLLFLGVFDNLRRSFPRVEDPAGYLPFLYFVAAAAVNVGQTRWSSLAYSTIYVAFFLFISSAHVPKRDLTAICKFIIGAYLANVIAAQLLYLVMGELGPFDWLLQGTVDKKTDVMRFHGFSSEPSYAAFVVVVAFMVYSRLGEESISVKWLWFAAVLYLLASFSSVYGYLLLGAFALAWLLRRGVIRPMVLAVVALATAIVALGAANLLSSNGESRVMQLAAFLLSGGWNLEEFRSVDSSAFMRVGPLLLYLSGFDPFSSHTYLGYGPGAAAKYFGTVFSDAIAADHKGFESGTINLGFLPGFLYDYGMIGVALVFSLVLRRGVSGILSLESAVLLLMLPNANFNTQLFWYVWGMFYLMNQCMNPSEAATSGSGSRSTVLSA